MRTQYRPKEVEEVVDLIKTTLEGRLVKLEFSGALRRQTPFVGGLTCVVSCLAPDAVRYMAERKADYRMRKVAMPPGVRLRAMTIDRVPVAFWTAREENWGAMLLATTGNKTFNILMRLAAKKQGYRLGYDGLFFGPDLIAGRTEEQIFYALGFKYVEPRKRVPRSVKRPVLVPDESY